MYNMICHYSHEMAVPIPVEDDTHRVRALSGAGAICSTENHDFK